MPEQDSQPQAGPSMAQRPACGLQQGHPPTDMGLTAHTNGMAIMNGATAQQRPRLRCPRPEELHMASRFVAELEANFINSYSKNMTKQAAPEQQKVEYIRTLGQAFHASQALYPKLPMFLCVFKNTDRTKQLVAMILATFLQRNLVHVGIQDRTLSLITLRDITQKLHECYAQVNAAVHEFIPQPQEANEVLMEDVVSDHGPGEPDAARDAIIRISEDTLLNHLSQPSAPGKSKVKRAKVGPIDT
ncbi:hypothetical protein FIBSPDRAFT_242235 [Athelia psychrophila]|uniref:Uncharacterized protein n=1 Tax=Athelia psychrophila TaxID=1759441 RepID=A0A165Y5E9_9AGAM|nr:hypothetical protein FIBSPDRAFT_242235 [Fibularhizoctonia sp. CBS 109695]